MIEVSSAAPEEYGKSSSPSWRTVNWENHKRLLPTSYGTMNYVEIGSGKAAVVFLHGLGNSWHFFADTIAKLAKNYRCLAIDLPGFGDSSRLLPLSRETLSQEVSANIEALTLDCDEVYLCGHSMGALIAMEIAETSRLHISGTILVSPGLDSLLHVLRHPFRSLVAEPLPAIGMLTQLALATLPSPRIIREASTRAAGLRQLLLSRYVARPRQIDPDAAAFVLSGLGRPTSMQAASLSRTFTLLRTRDIPGWVRIITGELDSQAPPEQAKALGDHVNCDQLYILGGVGHWPMVESPDEFAVAVERALADVPDATGTPTRD